MIVVLLITGTLGLLFSFVYAEKSWQKLATSVLFLVFIGSIVLSVANTDFHFGMEKVTTTKTTELVSSGDANADIDILLHQELDKKGEETIYIYKTSPNQKKPSTTKADRSVTNKVETGAKKAEKVTKTTHWEYKNKWYKFVFGVYANDHEYLKQTNTFKLPDSWIQLSTDEAKKLEKLVKEKEEEQSTPEAQKQSKEAAQAYVKNGLAEEIKTNPDMSKAEQEKVTEKLTKEFVEKAKKEALDQLIDEVKN